MVEQSQPLLAASATTNHISKVSTMPVPTRKKGLFYKRWVESWEIAGRGAMDIPVLGSSFASLSLWMMSVMDLIVPFL